MVDIDLRATLAKSRIVGLYHLMAGYKWLYLSALVAGAIGALVRTYYYRLVRHIVDNVLGQSEASGQLPLMAGAFVGLAVLEGGLFYIRGTWSAKTAEGITLRLRNYLYDHIQRLPFGFHDYVKTGELIQRSTSDVDAVRRFFADQAVGIGRIVSLFAVNLVMLIQMNPRLALTSVAVIPVIVALSYFFFGRVTKAYEEYQEQEAKLSSVLQENLTGVRVVRAFARQQYETAKFDRENFGKYRQGRRLAMMHAAYWPVSDILSAGQTVLAMAVGAMMAIRGEITVGTYLAAMGMVTWIIWPMRNLGRLVVQISTGLVSYQRVAAVIREEREDITTGDVSMEAAIQGQVTFDHVSFSYEPRAVLQDSESKKPRKRVKKADAATSDPAATAPQAPVGILKDITFGCEPGQVVALLGSTGSGKTSIVNLLLRFYDYQEGSVRLDGIELRSYPRALLRRNIGIVEQEPFLFSRSIRENIAYGAKGAVSQDEIVAAAKAAAIHDIVLTFPEGYDTVVGEKGVTLSGGQRQRVAIARALLKDPRILVLDDATSSVDTETEEQIQTALARLMVGRTSFVIAHRIQTVMDADLILVLDKGRIVQSGSHTDLIEQDGLYREIYDIQSRIDDEVQQEVAREGAPCVEGGQ
ncbi:MAG: ABC transporter ATP-binding protein/permease [Anaerolineae bacterium]|nr:ABC transporter ATP-binding protein/permease [Anaerolineae bacterium]